MKNYVEIVNKSPVKNSLNNMDLTVTDYSNLGILAQVGKIMDTIRLFVIQSEDFIIPEERVISLKNTLEKEIGIFFWYLALDAQSVDHKNCYDHFVERVKTVKEIITPLDFQDDDKQSQLAILSVLGRIQELMETPIVVLALFDLDFDSILRRSLQEAKTVHPEHFSC